MLCAAADIVFWCLLHGNEPDRIWILRGVIMFKYILICDIIHHYCSDNLQE